MASTITIPLTTLTAGGHDFGPGALPDADSSVTMTVDRTVANGLNATPSAQVIISVYQSDDSGATWIFLASATVSGGVFTNPRTGSSFTSSSVTVGFIPGTGRQLKGNVMVSGASVAVSGSIVTS